MGEASSFGRLLSLYYTGVQWQDVVIGVGQWALSAALLPSLFSADKPALSSSLLTGSILLVFSAVFLTLDLWASALALCVTSVIWLVLAIQKLHSQHVNDGVADG
ncbi:MAG: hypothetical protein HW416_15 [Chloroflexi bacterium]|nr:hypothetical protein [Chloroflexota bacterium]